MSRDTFEWRPAELEDHQARNAPMGNYHTPGGMYASRRWLTQLDAQIEIERLLNWKPPAGHKTWCDTQNPPPMRHSHVGDTPMAKRGACDCGKNYPGKRFLSA